MVNNFNCRGFGPLLEDKLCLIFKLAPSVPTFKEAGLDLVATGWNTFFAPASMPAAQVERLSQHIHEVMKDPDTRRKFEATKLEPVAASRAQTEATLKAYKAQWAPVVQRSGFKP